ncbi:ferric-dicitrate binding protein FerR (iron transport regulator) [Dyadobacter jejuensis]|uniref:Ferric-dicitrate binding protein FerR (Iron transport regulator) n=1 Tax=Dyadobacter jejuensis TaxID=1082580 RepID=A0A316ALZ3_9BACT|nr:FecR family protein [Dyadobacter jejuensis]PWJ58289.1 ferric-dicitrate binding protein FerR (iron transport regulator) [Dyadobacter jejuensis]
MSYKHYQLDDFLLYQPFREWCLAPDPESDAYWQGVIEEYPEKNEIIQQARQLLVSLHKESNLNAPTVKQVTSMWSQIDHYIVSDEKQITPNRTFRFLATYSAAAVVLLVCGWAIWSYVLKPDYSYQSQTFPIRNTLIEKVNLGPSSLMVILPDSSTITLQPNSKLSYPTAFARNEKREVYLTGEAFFNVTKNANKPFFVYSHELVTKVLGTSFTIKAFEKSKVMEVAVKTGKVSVFSRKSKSHSFLQKDQRPNATLTPNQRAIYTRDIIDIEKQLIENPAPLLTPYQLGKVSQYQDTGVGAILDNLEAIYGIKIEFDRNLYRNCVLTASFTNESLFDRINLICKGLESTYSVKDGKIWIEGPGCL